MCAGIEFPTGFVGCIRGCDAGASPKTILRLHIFRTSGGRSPVENWGRFIYSNLPTESCRATERHETFGPFMHQGGLRASARGFHPCFDRPPSAGGRQ